MSNWRLIDPGEKFRRSLHESYCFYYSPRFSRSAASDRRAIGDLTRRGGIEKVRSCERTIGRSTGDLNFQSLTYLPTYAPVSNHERVTRVVRTPSRRIHTTSGITPRVIRIIGSLYFYLFSSLSFSQRDTEAVSCGALRGAATLSSRAFTVVIIIVVVIWRLLFFRSADLMDGSVITRFSTFVSVDNESR